MADVADRAALADQLRAEAYALLQDTGLFALLQQRFTDPSVTGSAGYNLMVWRHINIHMPVEPDRWVEWAGLAADLATQLAAVDLTLAQAHLRNTYFEPHPHGAGLNWTIWFANHSGNDWTLDLWGWDPFDYAIRQARDFSLRTDLGAVDRDLILRLKSEARARPDYAADITSTDIYEFVIADAGDNLEALAAWRRKR